MNEELLQTNMEIISHAGLAKTMYMEAIELARKKQFDEADQRFAEGREEYLRAHKAHLKILQLFAGGEKIEPDLMLIHAENHLSSAELNGHLAKEIIELHKERTGG